MELSPKHRLIFIVESGFQWLIVAYVILFVCDIKIILNWMNFICGKCWWKLEKKENYQYLNNSFLFWSDGFLNIFFQPPEHHRFEQQLQLLYLIFSFKSSEFLKKGLTTCEL